MKFRTGVIIAVLPCFILGGIPGYLDGIISRDIRDKCLDTIVITQNELFLQKAEMVASQFHLSRSEFTPSPNKEETRLENIASRKLTVKNALCELTIAIKTPEQVRIAKIEEDFLKAWELNKAFAPIPLPPITKVNPLGWKENIAQKARRVREKIEYDIQFDDFWTANAGTISDTIRIINQGRTEIPQEMSPLQLNQIAAAIRLMPQDFLGKLKAIYLVSGDKDMRRGFSGLGVIFINIDNADLFAATIHELGHVYDLHKKYEAGVASDFHNGISQLTDDDVSVGFYRLSWENNAEHRGTNDDFVSWYAASNPMEDFAETFALYILQGSTFAEWSETNTVLLEKYEFMKKIYRGEEFESAKTYDTRPFSVIDYPIDFGTAIAIAQ